MVIVVLTLIANIASIVIYYISPDLSSVRVVVAIRELSIYLALILIFILIRRFRLPIFHPLDKLFLLLLLMYTFFIMLSIPRYSISSMLMGRELIFPVATFFVFRFLNLSGKHIRQILLFVIGLAFIAGILAIIEQVYINFIKRSRKAGCEPNRLCRSGALIKTKNSKSEYRNPKQIRNPYA